MTHTLYQEHLEDELTRYKTAEAQDMDRKTGTRPNQTRTDSNDQRSFPD